MMKTTFQFNDLNIRSSWYPMLEQHVDYWQRLTAVTATEVVLERQHYGKSGFRVQVRLELSEGSVLAEGTASNLKSALLMASGELETKIQARKARRREGRAHASPPGQEASNEAIIQGLSPEISNLACQTVLPL